MTEVIVTGPNGNTVGNTQGIQTVSPRHMDGVVRRVTQIDLEGPIGEFLGPALCFISPNGWHANNWKSKLSTFVTSKTASFICCGRAVALAYVEQDAMGGVNEAMGLFLLVADGGTEDDATTILRHQKQWARDMGMGYRPPLKEYSALSQSKIQQALKAEKREELWVPPLKK